MKKKLFTKFRSCSRVGLRIKRKQFGVSLLEKSLYNIEIYKKLCG